MFSNVVRDIAFASLEPKFGSSTLTVKQWRALSPLSKKSFTSRRLNKNLRYSFLDRSLYIERGFVMKSE